MTGVSGGRYRVGRCVIGTSLLLALSGCGGLSDVDRRTDELIQARSRALGIDVRPPVARTAEPPAVDKDTVTRKQPPSVNPDAADLRFPPLRPEDDAAEIERRLAEFQGDTAEDATPLDLAAALRLAQDSAREYLNAEEEYILAAIRVLIERHLWSPRLFNDTSVDLTGSRFDSSTRSAVRVLNELGVTQRLPFGGDIAARWVVEATETLRSAATEQYVQSSRLVLDGRIPLLRGAGLVAQEGLIQSERNLIYAARDFENFRRQFLVAIARDYFALLQLQAAIENTRRQVEGLRDLEERERALYEAERVPEFRLNLARANVLRAAAALATSRESYILRLDAFKIRLGLPPDASVAIRPGEINLPIPDESLSAAAEKALAYRLDLQNQRDRLDDARRGVRNAQNNILPDLDLRGGVGIATDRNERIGGLGFEDLTYNAGITFGLPLDREIERLQLRSAIISAQQAQRRYELFRDNVALDARAQLREIERARLSLVLAEQQVAINERRLEEQRLRADEVTPQDRVDTENDLIQSRNDRDQALTALRNAVLDYLLVTGQLRVGRDGTLIPLPGMSEADAPPDALDPRGRLTTEEAAPPALPRSVETSPPGATPEVRDPQER